MFFRLSLLLFIALICLNASSVYAEILPKIVEVEPPDQSASPHPERESENETMAELKHRPTFRFGFFAPLVDTGFAGYCLYGDCDRRVVVVSPEINLYVDKMVGPVTLGGGLGFAYPTTVTQGGLRLTVIRMPFRLYVPITLSRSWDFNPGFWTGLSYAHADKSLLGLFAMGSLQFVYWHSTIGFTLGIEAGYDSIGRIAGHGSAELGHFFRLPIGIVFGYECNPPATKNAEPHGPALLRNLSN